MKDCGAPLAVDINDIIAAPSASVSSLFINWKRVLHLHHRRVREYLVERWRLKSRLGYRYVEGDVEWNPKNTLRYPAICFFAGFFAGLFGVGGGIVKGPLMLEMGELGGTRGIIVVSSIEI